jgi:hypothetical protein
MAAQRDHRHLPLVDEGTDAVRFSEEILKLHRAPQRELTQNGTSHYAMQLDRLIWTRLGRVPGIDDDPGKELHQLEESEIPGMLHPRLGSEPSRNLFEWIT